jgi:hypothetical protein
LIASIDTPSSASVFQNGSPVRRLDVSGTPSAGTSKRVVATLGSHGGPSCASRRSRAMKSKIPCEPGGVPVANDVQATGDCGGFVDPSRRYARPPCALVSLVVCGSLPSAE